MKKLFPLLLWIGNLIAIILIWRIHAHFRSPAATLISLGDLAGLIAFYLILCQLLLIGRIGWIERAWGHDKLSRLHHTMGVVAICIIALHPLLLIAGYSLIGGISAPRQFWIFLTQYEDILLAVVAYVMFLSIIFVSLNIVRKKLRYESWYYVHVLLYLAVIFAFEHQGGLGRDLANPSVAIYWNILFYGTLINVIYYRFARPIWQSLRGNFRVTKIIRETHDVVSIYLSGNLSFQPGQFIIVRFLTKNLWWEAHPFTISSDSVLRITPKAVGDFTKKIPAIPVGTRLYIEGPLGKFTPDRAAHMPVLMIAGGIGVTPLRSLFAKLPQAKFIYAARSTEDFALKNELDRIGPVIYTTEKLTTEFIKNQVPDVANRFVYVCGPVPMMTMVKEQLRHLGVPKRHILHEKFQLG